MLHITKRYDNGYHHLQSLFGFCAFGDTVFVGPSNSNSFDVSYEGIFEKIPHENSLTKARDLFQEKFKASPVSIRLIKRIPIAAGLGGGSSDGAAVFAALSRLFNVDPKDCLSLAAEIGADTPVCLTALISKSPLLWVEGTGHEGGIPVDSSLFQDLDFILVNPRKPLSTQTLYQRLSPPFDSPIEKEYTLENFASTYNVFEKHAAHMLPEVGKILGILKEKSLYARLSGSGLTCWAAYEKGLQADNLGELGDFWKVQTNLVGPAGLEPATTPL